MGSSLANIRYLFLTYPAGVRVRRKKGILPFFQTVDPMGDLRACGNRRVANASTEVEGAR
jgi:hypothetical protein